MITFKVVKMSGDTEDIAGDAVHSDNNNYIITLAGEAVYVVPKKDCSCISPVEEK